MPALLSWIVLYPLWHNSPYRPRSWPLSLAAGWAQVLASWDYARGRTLSWSPASRPAVRRLWRGIAGWNGGLGLAWVALAAWRIEQTGSWRFAVVTVIGVVNLAVVGRLIASSRT